MKTSHQHCVLVATFAIALFSTDPAMANRLADAAVQGQSLVLTIAQATSVIGIAVGGILMSVGWGSAGKATLGGGVVGAFASIGAPAMISFVKEVFGS